MSERLPPPWLRFPDLLRDPRPPQEAVDQFTDWLRFLHALSPDELVEYERDHPAPTGWEEFCRMPARLRDAAQHFNDVIAPQLALIEKMWQTTTLK